MQQKIEKIIMIIALVGIATGIGAHVYSRIQGSLPSPTFSFNKESAPGWWASDNVDVQEVARTSNYTGQTPISELPTSDLTIFQGESEDERTVDGCFVSFSYYKNRLADINAAYDDYFDRKDTDDGKLDTFDPIKQTISTFEGKKEYDLRQYRLVFEGQDTMQGYQVGFIPLDSGYIRTEGVCMTYEELEITKPVLESIELVEP